MIRILVVSHCILNKASKVKQDENDLEEEYRIRQQFLEKIVEKDIQLIQLPCPEFLIYGSRRWGHVKDQFQHPHFKKECKKMLMPVLMQMEEYLSYPKEYEIIGIVSVEGSPSCGFNLTCRGHWGGEIGNNPDAIAEIQSNLSMNEEPGVFMQILLDEIQSKNMDVPVLRMQEAIEKI